MPRDATPKLPPAVSRLLAFGRLPLTGKIAALHAAAVAVAVEAGLRTLPVPRLARLLGVRLVTDRRAVSAAGEETHTLNLSDAERRRLRAAQAVLRARPGRGRCLRRALVAGHLLRERRPELRIGVAREGGRVHAHAWIEIDGLPLDGGTAGFTPLTAGRGAPRLPKGNTMLRDGAEPEGAKPADLT
ncbi:MAG: lasso peptide biosynthesis B2 protein [Acidobacteria bacterium]|nr:lasso peptide biosynthesis B2 protein [Acidobacteriota bacterium]